MTALELLGVLAIGALVAVSVLYALAGLIRRDLEDQDDDAALYPSEYYDVTLTAEQAAGMRLTFSDGSYRELRADGLWEWHPAPDTETAPADPTR